MDYRDALLTLTSYPDPTPDNVVDDAVALASILGTKLSALMFVLTRSRVARRFSSAEFLLDVPKLIDQSIAESARQADRLLERFESEAKVLGIFKGRHLEPSTVFPWGQAVVKHARVKDITFVPVTDPTGMTEEFAEPIVFGSGRPTVLLPAYTGRKGRQPALKTVAVAWDFSRAAARALADAMPILQRAQKVQVFTVTGEKDIEESSQTAEFEEHLKDHGIDAPLETVEARGRGIGDVLKDYTSAHDVDLLVMGAFGHSRFREFILGGATRDMLDRPPIPVFLSH